jgi:hypothetical protein
MDAVSKQTTCGAFGSARRAASSAATARLMERGERCQGRDAPHDVVVDDRGAQVSTAMHHAMAGGVDTVEAGEVDRVGRPVPRVDRALGVDVVTVEDAQLQG